MDFDENEIVIANEKFKNAMPYRAGERCKVIEKLHSSLQFQYNVEFDDGVKCKAKESELTKLSEEDKQYMEHIRQGYEVEYTPISEKVVIVKCDYIHKTAEIRHYQDGEEQVVLFGSLRPVGSEVEKC